jgi:hypothetical protein
MARSGHGGARKDLPLRINGCKDRPVPTTGRYLASRRAAGGAAEKGMWQQVYVGRHPRTWRDRDRKWSPSEVSAGNRCSQASAGQHRGGRTATQAGHHVVSLTRSGTGRCISSISRVSCEARRSSRTACASAFSARFRSAAFCVASCRVDSSPGDHAPMFQSAIGVSHMGRFLDVWQPGAARQGLHGGSRRWHCGRRLPHERAQPLSGGASHHAEGGRAPRADAPRCGRVASLAEWLRRQIAS